VENVTTEMLLKLGSKENVAKWLLCAVQLLDRQHNFVMNQRVNISCYQEDIIKLQGEVIDDQRKALETVNFCSSCVQDSIKTGLDSVECSVRTSLYNVEDTLKEGLEKSYGEVAASKQQVSCSTVISQEALKTVAKQVIVEEELSKKIMIFGLPETDNEKVQVSVSEVFETIGEKPRLEAVRLGKKVQSKVRPVKVTLPSSSIVQQLLSSSWKLRQSDSYKNVFLSPDRTDKERAEHRELVSTLKEKSAAEPNKKHFIEAGEIVSVDP
jgi:hypothetical protein